MTEHPAPTRAASTPTFRRVARLVLVVGIVVATAAAFGPLWAVRVGIVIAAAAGVVACAYAWREATAERRAGTAALLAASREHGAALTAERTHNADVVDVLTERVATAHRELADRRLELTERRAQLAALSGTVVALREDAAALRIELGQREATVDALRDTLAAREAELRVLTAEDGDDAQVHAWPRHLRTDALSSADGDPVDVDPADVDRTDVDPADTALGELPTVVDLRAVDAGRPAIRNHEPAEPRSVRQA